MHNRWPVVRCADVIDVRDGTHDTPESVPSGIPLVTSKNLRNGEIDFTGTSLISEVDHRKISARSKVEKGDVLFAMIGTIGNPVIVRDDREFSIKNIALFKFASSEVSNSYFRHLLESDLIKSQLSRESRGGTQKFVSLSALRGLKIPLPPLDEQRRIAAILDKAESLLAKRHQAVAKLDRLLTAIFSDVCARAQTAPARLREIATLRTGKLDSNAAVAGGEFPFFTCSKDDLSIDVFAFDQEALLLAGNNAVGDYSVKHYKGKFNAYQRTYVLTLDESVCTYEYIKHALSSKLLELRQSSKGTGTKYLTLEILDRLKLDLPTLDAQRQFSMHASQTETIRKLQAASAEKLLSLATALRSSAFAGQI